MSLSQETGTVLRSSVTCNCSLNGDEPFRKHRTQRLIGRVLLLFLVLLLFFSSSFSKTLLQSWKVLLNFLRMDVLLSGGTLASY